MFHWTFCCTCQSQVPISTTPHQLKNSSGVRGLTDRKNSIFDLDLWHMTLTYSPNLPKVKVDFMPKNQGQRSNCSTGEHKQTNTQMDGQTDVTKHIISPALRSINIACYMGENYAWLWYYKFVMQNTITLEIPWKIIKPLQTLPCTVAERFEQILI